MNNMNPFLATDGYKTSHYNQYPEGTTLVYSNFTPRSNKHAPKGCDKVVVFGTQMIWKQIQEMFDKDFFKIEEIFLISEEPEVCRKYSIRVKDKVCQEIKKEYSQYLGFDYDVSHIEALWDLGYLPIEVKALEEGTLCPMGVPVMTLYNTHPDFYWLPNFLETLISNLLWKPMTSATIALQYRRLMEEWALKTDKENVGFVDFQGHDFSMRGMDSIDATISSGLGHATSFLGSDSLPVIYGARKYYGEKDFVIGSVPACYDDQTEILTDKGWKFFNDLEQTDLVGQVDFEGNIELVKPLNYFKDPYKGKLIHFKSKEGKILNTDIMVTPNHRMVRLDSNSNVKMFEASKDNFKTKDSIIVSGKLKIDNNSELTPLEKLKIAFQADGSFPSHQEDYTGIKGKGFPIRFSLKKDRKRNRLVQILNDANINYTETKYDNGYYSFWINSPDKLTKDFSWVEIDKFGQNKADSFIEELQYWDGSKKNNCIVYSSTNKDCIDMVQAICSISLRKAKYNNYEDKRTDYKRKLIHTLTIQDNKFKVGARSVEKIEVDYDGFVYCVSVPTKMLVIRRNNCVSICGNTEHSVMCAGSKDDEIGTFRRLMKTYPTGILSIVSDTWDLWKVLTEYLPELKEEILARDGKIVIRPDCYSDDTSVLTKEGWKLFTDLNPNRDLIAQVLDDGTYEFVKPLKYVNEPYKGEMVSYKDHYGKIDLLVTPNHRMIYDNGSGSFQVQEAKDCNFSWKKDIRRSALAPNLGKELSPLEALKIAFQADGSYQSTGNKIRFSFSKQRKIERLEGILNDCNIDYVIYDLKDGRVEFNIDVDAIEFNKDFSWVDISDLCSNWCQEFIEELSYWDATRRHDRRFKFDTTTESVIRVVEYVAMSAGYGVLVRETEDARKLHFSSVFTAHILKNNKLGGQSIKKEIVKYDGNIVCVTVPTGRLVVKRHAGQLVCGNSGDPVDIICGELFDGCSDTDIREGLEPELIEMHKNTVEGKGVIELLWDVFGGTINEQGYKVLDPHIGAIYGDSITLERAEQICKRLEAKGFASTNVVFGIGSFTYQYNTRDTFGFAMKATYVEIKCDGETCKRLEEGWSTLSSCEKCKGNQILGREIFKDPVTDDGTKKSAKGLLAVYNHPVKKEPIYLKDQCTWEEEKEGLLQTIFKDSVFINETTLTEIRKRLKFTKL